MALRRMLTSNHALAGICSVRAFGLSPVLLRNKSEQDSNAIHLPPSDNSLHYHRATAAAFAFDGNLSDGSQQKVNSAGDLRSSENNNNNDNGYISVPTPEDLLYDNARQPSPTFWFDMATETEIVNSEGKEDGSVLTDYHRAATRNGKVVDEEHIRTTMPSKKKQQSS